MKQANAFKCLDRPSAQADTVVWPDLGNDLDMWGWPRADPLSFPVCCAVMIPSPFAESQNTPHVATMVTQLRDRGIGWTL